MLGNLWVQIKGEELKIIFHKSVTGRRERNIKGHFCLKIAKLTALWFSKYYLVECSKSR